MNSVFFFSCIEMQKIAATYGQRAAEFALEHATTTLEKERLVWSYYFDLWCIEGNTLLIDPEEAEYTACPRTIRFDKGDDGIILRYDDVHGTLNSSTTPSMGPFFADMQNRILGNASMSKGAFLRAIITEFLWRNFNVMIMSVVDYWIAIPLKFGEDAYRYARRSEALIRSNVEHIYKVYKIYYDGMRDLDVRKDPEWYQYQLDPFYEIHFGGGGIGVSSLVLTYDYVECFDTDEEFMNVILDSAYIVTKHTKNTLRWDFVQMDPLRLRIFMTYCLNAMDLKYRPPPKGSLIQFPIRRPLTFTDLPKDLQVYVLQSDVQTLLSSARVNRTLAEYMRNDYVWESLFKKDYPNEYSWIRGQVPMFVANPYAPIPHIPNVYYQNETKWKTFYLCVRYIAKQLFYTSIQNMVAPGSSDQKLSKRELRAQVHRTAIIQRIAFLLSNFVIDLEILNGTTAAEQNTDLIRTILRLKCMGLSGSSFRYKYRKMVAVAYMNDFRRDNPNFTTKELREAMDRAAQIENAPITTANIRAAYEQEMPDRSVHPLLHFILNFMLDEGYPDAFPREWFVDFRNLISNESGPIFQQYGDDAKMHLLNLFNMYADSYQHPICIFNMCSLWGPSAFFLENQPNNWALLMVDSFYENMGILRNSMLSYEATLMMKHVYELGLMENNWEISAHFHASTGAYDELIATKYPDERTFEQSIYILRPHLINSVYRDDPLTAFCADLNLLLEWFDFAPRRKRDGMKLVTASLAQSCNRRIESNAAVQWFEQLCRDKKK